MDQYLWNTRFWFGIIDNFYTIHRVPRNVFGIWDEMVKYIEIYICLYPVSCFDPIEKPWKLFVECIIEGRNKCAQDSRLSRRRWMA